MKKTVYISGPISDPTTGQPREGWQKDFLEAEARLRAMGFEVINPVKIAKETEEDWENILADRWVSRTLAYKGEQPPRIVYLFRCINEIFESALRGSERVTLHGLYVIGHPDQVQRSYGTMCEINFALSASLPVYSQHYHGYQTDNRLRQLTDRPTLAEAAGRNDNE